MAELVVTPYSTAVTLAAKSIPGWINAYDAQRYAAYGVYDDMYKNYQGTYALVSRGAENKPVYIPTARTIVNTLNRYTAVAPALKYTSPTDSATEAAKLAFENLFKRERFWSKFNSNKLLGARRGDWLWYIVADPAKPQGSRLSIYALDPRQYFPITLENDVDKIVGCHIVEQIVVGDKTLVKRQTYTKGADPLKAYDPADTSIWYTSSVWELEQWEDPTKSPVSILVPPTQLPPQITALPVYHIPHNEEVGDPFGISDLQGYEEVLAEIIQATSDESLALALEGLGMYATTSGPPRDETTGREVPWRLGPGRVVEHPDGTEFRRVNGIGTVNPYQDHLNFVIEHGVFRPAGLTNASLGKVDASIAESGVALALQLAPTLAATEKNDTTIKAVHDQFLFDLKAWFSAYEQTTLDEGLIVEMVFGNKIPVNRKERVQELLDMYDKGLIDSAFFRSEMSQFGYTFPEGMALAIAQEKKEALDLMQDDTVTRSVGELNTPESDLGE